jgi:hypothetical protein
VAEVWTTNGPTSSFGSASVSDGPSIVRVTLPPGEGRTPSSIAFRIVA